MALDGSRKHAVRVITRVDSVLDVEAQLLAPVLDHAHNFAREPLELQLLSDHRVELHLRRAERDALDVELLAHDGRDVVGQRIAGKRDAGERLADLYPGGIPGGEPRPHRLPGP